MEVTDLFQRYFIKPKRESLKNVKEKTKKGIHNYESLSLK